MPRAFHHILLPLVLLAAVDGSAAGRIDTPPPATLGRFDAQEEKHTSFRLRNSGDKPVAIREVQTTCACAEAWTDRNTFGPGETATITVRLAPFGLSGPFSILALVNTDAPENTSIPLMLAGEAVPLAQIVPRDTLDAGRLRPGETWSGSFTIIPTRPEIVFGSPSVTSAVPATVSLDTAANRLTITLDPPPHFAGAADATILLPFIAPTNVPPLRLRAVARIGAELVAVPGEVRLAATAENDTRTVPLRLLAPAARTLSANDVSVTPPPGIAVRLAPGSDPASLRLTVASEPAGIRTNALLRLAVPDAAPAAVRIRFR